MKVFKFGGASVNSVDRIKNLASIVERYREEQLVIIISAMGKTTNALEKVVEAFYAGKKKRQYSCLKSSKTSILLLPNIYWLHIIMAAQNNSTIFLQK